MSSSLIHHIFSLFLAIKKSSRDSDEIILHLGFVYIRSVILYEKLDFYDCGLLEAYSAAALAWVAFHG